MGRPLVQPLQTLPTMRALALLVLLTLALPVGADGPPTVTDPESYRVYAAALALDRHTRDLASIHLREMTVTFDDCMSKGERLPADWRDVLSDYRAQNGAPSRLLEGMNLPVPYVLLSSDVIVGVQKAWLQWLERTQGAAEVSEPMPAPTEFFEVSAVGFDHSRQRALVYVAHYCGFSCAGGQHWLLERRDGEWVRFPTTVECVWIAD